MRLLRDLSTLNHARIILWCAFIWYAAMVARYGEPKPALWVRSLGLAAIVGTILTLNAVPRSGGIRGLGFWPLFRFFLIPFCVSSFSTFTTGHGFILIFPPSRPGNASAVIPVVIFRTVVGVAKILPPAEPTERKKHSTLKAP